MQSFSGTEWKTEKNKRGIKTRIYYAHFRTKGQKWRNIKGWNPIATFPMKFFRTGDIGLLKILWNSFGMVRFIGILQDSFCQETEPHEKLPLCHSPSFSYTPLDILWGCLVSSLGTIWPCLFAVRNTCAVKCTLVHRWASIPVENWL